MARSVRGRVQNGALPAWPPLRVRALVNGLCLTLFGLLLFHLTWNMLGFEVFDAERTAMVLRVLAIGVAIALPLGCVTIGLHLMFTAVTASDRLLLAHGAASWDPGEHDDVLRGVRVRNWRPKTGAESGAFSARTLGWVPVQTPVALVPLALGLLVTVVMMIWVSTGYGRAALVLLVTLAWVGWRAFRAWGAWSDFRTDRLRRPQTAPGTTRPGTPEPAASADGGRVMVITADEAWDDDDAAPYQPPPHPDPYQREQQLRRAMSQDSEASNLRRTEDSGLRHNNDQSLRRNNDASLRRSNDVRVVATQHPDTHPHDRSRRRDDVTETLPVVLDPDADADQYDTGPIEILGSPGHDDAEQHRRGRARGSRRRGRDADAEPEVVLVDRSAQRARQARDRRKGQETAGDSRPGRRGRANGHGSRSTAPEPSPSQESAAANRSRRRGLRRYLGDRESAPSQARDGHAGPATGTDRVRTVRRTGAPSRAEAEREIYQKRDEADSIFGYLMRRPKDD